MEDITVLKADIDKKLDKVGILDCIALLTMLRSDVRLLSTLLSVT